MKELTKKIQEIDLEWVRLAEMIERPADKKEIEKQKVLIIKLIEKL